MNPRPAMDRPDHSVTVVDARSSSAEPERLMARCSCGWKGRAFTGQEVRRAAEADGREHLMRAARSPDGYDPRRPAED